MKPTALPLWLQRNLTKIVACLLVIFLFFQTRLLDISASTASLLAALRKRNLVPGEIPAEVPVAFRAAS